MNKHKPSNRFGIFSLSILLGAFLGSAEATNGLFQHGYGAKQASLAGSGMAFPQDPLIAAQNPAGLAFLGSGYVLDLQWFRPLRDYHVEGAAGAFPPFPGPEVESDSKNFAIPALAMSRIIDSNSVYGLALYGNGGMNTDYASHDTPFGIGAFGGDHAGVDYAQVFLNLSYARKFADGKASWGLAGIANYSYLRMNGLSGFSGFSLSPNHVSDEGYDRAIGLGFIASVMGQITPDTHIALAYQSQIKNTFDDYKGLFANGGELDIPAFVQIGLSTKLGHGHLNFDVQKIFYSESDSIGNTSQVLATSCAPSVLSMMGPNANCLGGNVGFGWDDMTVFKLGYSWKAQNGWTWRTGISYGDQPIPDEEVTFNIIAPGVIEKHFTVGVSVPLKSESELNLSLMYAPENCVSGNDLFTPGKTVELCMRQYSMNLGYSF